MRQRPRAGRSRQAHRQGDDRHLAQCAGRYRNFRQVALTTDRSIAMFDLTGKTAIVTGASGGIGGAIAKALHSRGAAVVLSGTRTDALEALAGALGERAHAIAARMDDAASIEALAKDADARLGKV